MSNERSVCEACGEHAAQRQLERQEFNYGSGESAVTLVAQMPVWSCDACGIEYVDAEGEAAQHAAVCKHLGRLQPSEVRAIRDSAGLSQRGFANELRVGMASVKRWETGLVIQNAAADAGMRAFHRRTVRVHLPEPRFRTPLSAEKRSAAPLFKLRGHCFEPMALAA